jgi:hypothetical protein
MLHFNPRVNDELDCLVVLALGLGGRRTVCGERKEESTLGKLTREGLAAFVNQDRAAIARRVPVAGLGLLRPQSGKNVPRVSSRDTMRSALFEILPKLIFDLPIDRVENLTDKS